MDDKEPQIKTVEGSITDTTGSDLEKTQQSKSRKSERRSTRQSITSLKLGSKDKQYLHQALFGLLPQKQSKIDETLNVTRSGDKSKEGDSSIANISIRDNVESFNLERQSASQPLRKTAIVRFSFNDIKDKLTRIDNRDIGAVVKNRFLGQHLSLTADDDIDGVERKLIEELPKHTIVQFIEKFGFVELNEVDNMFVREPSKSNLSDQTQSEEAKRTSVPIDPEAALESIEGGFDMSPTLLPEKKLQLQFEVQKNDPLRLTFREPFTFGEEKLLDSNIYLEDITEEPLLETEIMNEINMSLEGQYSSTICSYAVSKKSRRIALFGTESGEIIECYPQDSKHPVRKNSLDGKITAIALSFEDDYYVAGSANSELLFKKTEGKMAKKFIKNLNQQKIGHIVFAENSSVLVGTLFNVYHFSIISYALLLEVTMTAVIPRQPFIVMQIAPLIFEGVMKIAVAMNDRVTLYSLVKEDNKKEAHVFKVGTDIEDASMSIAPQNNKWVPVVQWIPTSATTAIPCFLIFWKSKITLVEFHNTEYVISVQRVILTNIIWGTLLENRILCLVNNQLEIELLSLERIFSPEYEPGTKHAKFPIIAGLLKDQRDVTYMTKYKDKLDDEEVEIAMKLPFFQFFRNRLKDLVDSVYMITDKGLMRYKLIGIEKLIDIYLIKNKTTAAVRMINNVFLGIIYVNDSEKQAIQEIVPQVVDSYIRNKLRSELLVEDQIRLIDAAIECLVCTENVDAVFEVVKSKFTPKLFWGEISKFIREKIITNIPYEELAHGVQYLESEEVVELLREFRIEAKDDDDQVINKVLMIIKKKNIWPFLYKFCVFYPSQSIPTFLTMLAAEILTMDHSIRKTILDEAIFQSTEDMDVDKYFEEPNRRLFFRLFWFFNLVFSPGALEKSLLHFTDEPLTIEKNMADIYAKTLEWLLDTNNSKIILDTSSQMFFELIFSCVMNQRLLKNSKVVDVVKKLKNIYLKKNEQPEGDGIKFVANFRATQNLNLDPYPFSVAENILMILEDILHYRYRKDIAFTAVKLLCFGNHERKFENQEWICHELLTMLDDDFDEGRYWLDYRPIHQDKFEDLVIGAADGLEKLKSIEDLKKRITAMAFDRK